MLCSPRDGLGASRLVAGPGDGILLTGAGGFIGLRVLDALLRRGHRRVRCLVRPSGDRPDLEALLRRHRAQDQVEVLPGNLLSPADCAKAAAGATVIYHLAAGRGDMFADAFMNSVVTTRNLLDAARATGALRRFVNVSSFSVYSNVDKVRRRLLDETCPVERAPAERGDPYTFGKAQQDELVLAYAAEAGLPYVIVRPGCVYGPGHPALTNRIGIGTFGLFLHLGGANTIPLTYVDNCAEAIVLAGLTPGVDGEVFNVVDDDLPSSREFLRQYKARVRRFPSVYVPHAVSYLLCSLWERYSSWSDGQLPPTFNRKSWHAFWKKTRYSNAKLKRVLGWEPAVSTAEGMARFFESCRPVSRHA